MKEGYTRVSQILAQLRNYSEINPVILEEKCKVGTEVHENIHRKHIGDFEEFDLYPIRDRHGNIIELEDGQQKWERRGVGYYQSYCKWQQQNYPYYELMEKRLYCKDLMITGQIDALMKHGHNYILVDFKTSYASDIEIWALQAHAYRYLLEINGYKDVNKMLWLQLQKNGRFPKIFEFDFNDKTLSRFIQLVHLYDDMLQSNKDVD